MTHQEQVSVLSQMHLQQVEEVKAQNWEILHLSALVKNSKRPLNGYLLPRVLLGRLGHELTLGPSWMQCGRQSLI